jgi:hypothetical protein
MSVPNSIGKRAVTNLLLFNLGALLLISQPARSADYWVVGSFKEETRAVAEQFRMSKVTGTEARITTFQKHNSTYFRVIIGPITDSLNLILNSTATNQRWRLRNFEIQVPEEAPEVEGRVEETVAGGKHNTEDVYALESASKTTADSFNLTRIHDPKPEKLAVESSSRFSGYIKSFAVAQDEISNDLFSVNNIYQSQNSFRLMWEHFGDTAVYQIHYEVSPVFVSRQFPIEGQTFSAVGDSYRLTDLKSSLSDEGDKTQVYQNLDRLNVQWQFDRGDLTIGRQAISFGAARFINPTDIFLPFNVQTLNQEYRTGVDAIRFQSPLGELGELDIGVVLGEDAKPENSAAFVQMRGNVAGNDLNFNVTRFAEQTMVGTGIQSALWDFGFWFEIAGVNGDVDYIRTSVGLDYAPSENTFVMLEYHYNGAGSDTPAEYLSLFSTIPYQRGGVFLLGQDYIMPSISFQLSPLWGLAMQAVYNLNDDSAFISASAEFNVVEDFYMDFGYYHFIGDKLGTTETGMPVLGSEYGSNPNVLYASLRFYF